MATEGEYTYYKIPLPYFTFFKNNNLLNEENIGSVFLITGSVDNTIKLQVKYENGQYKLYTYGNFFSTDETNTIMSKKDVIYGRDGSTRTDFVNDIITKIVKRTKGDTRRIEGRDGSTTTIPNKSLSPKKTMKDNEEYPIMETIIFPDEPVTILNFFRKNKLLDEKYNNSIFKLTGAGGGNTMTLKKINKGVFLSSTTYDTMVEVSYKFLQTKNGDNDIITKLEIIDPPTSTFEEQGNRYGRINTPEHKRTYIKKTTGGRKASVKKEVCGKLRCIYKIPGSRKEHLKYKGQLIPVADFKKLMK